MSTSRWDNLTDIALWFRAVARIEVAAERLVPGPLDADDVPYVDGPADPLLGPQWSDWWHAMLKAPDAVRGGAFPGADGLSAAPQLRDLVAARWLEAHKWHTARQRREFDPRHPASLTASEVVRDFERREGRGARPFHAAFLVIPVRDDVIRRIDGERYLVPEPVYTGRQWRVWLAGLVDRLA